MDALSAVKDVPVVLLMGAAIPVQGPTTTGRLLSASLAGQAVQAVLFMEAVTPVASRPTISHQPDVSPAALDALHAVNMVVVTPAQTPRIPLQATPASSVEISVLSAQ